MNNSIPHRSVLNTNPPQTHSDISAKNLKNLTSLATGAAAGGAVSLGISSVALKTALIAAGAAASLATFSPLAAAAATSIVGLDWATGLPITKMLFAGAAFLATRWATKSVISAGQAMVEAFQTAKNLGKKMITGIEDLIGSQRPLTTTAPRQAVPQYAT